MLVNRVHKPYLCKICKKTAGVKACKCQKAFYCSKICQKVDWSLHRKDCCFIFVDHPGGKKTSSTINSTNNTPCASSTLSLPSSVQQHESNLQIPDQNTNAVREGRKEYDPTPLQYQHNDSVYSYNDEGTAGVSSAVNENELDENLFSLMSKIVDQRTEEEFLKNLNIRADEFLAAYSLDNVNVQASASQIFKEYVPIENVEPVDDQITDRLFEQLQQEEFQPEAQQLLQETKDSLEKELSLLLESQQNLNTMQLSPPNPKYVNHTTVQDNTIMRTPDEQMALEEMCYSVIRDLNAYGVCVLDSFLGEEKGLRVLSEVKKMRQSGMFRDGQLVGATKTKINQKHIRGDKIMWVDGKEEGLESIKFLMNQVDAVITLANRITNNGKLGQHCIRERTKAMVACYEGKGSHYVKHVDNPNSDGRCITCIYYLNVNWDVSEDGGLLRIYPSVWTDRVADIEPIFDRITFFWSDRRNPHEVQPAHRTRYAITLWYFDAHEREQAVRKYQRDCESLRKVA